MLRIGFAREGDHQAQSTPEHNPFLRLVGLGADRTRPGYVVTHRGVQAGLGPAKEYTSLLTVRLTRQSASDDWSPPPVCISVANHAPPACGTLLVDTGVSRMFLTVLREQLDGAVTEQDGHMALQDGTQVGVQLGVSGDPPWGYTFRSADRADARAPGGITLVHPGERPTFMNTSVHFLNGGLQGSELKQG